MTKALCIRGLMHGKGFKKRTADALGGHDEKEG